MPIECCICGWKSDSGKHKNRNDCPICHFEVIWNDVVVCKCCKKKCSSVQKNGLCISCFNKNETETKADSATRVSQVSVFGYNKRAYGSFESGKK